MMMNNSYLKILHIQLTGFNRVYKIKLKKKDFSCLIYVYIIIDQIVIAKAS